MKDPRRSNLKGQSAPWRRLTGTLAIFILLLSACSGPVKKPQTESPDTAEGRELIIMHPTVKNLQTFLYLTTEGIFPLPADYQITGVYNSLAAYD